MSYRIINVTQEFKSQWGPLDGLEGPFFYDGNRVLYYDTKVGKYYNPILDWYLDYDEYEELTGT